MSGKRPFLSVYGHVTVDQIISVRDFPRLNESVDVISKSTLLGGTGSNIAVNAAGLGVPTAICAFVGEDFPINYEKFMIDSGLIMDDFVRVKEYESSQAIVLNNEKFEQKVIFYQGPQGYAGELDIMLLSSAMASEYVHFCTGEPEYYISVMGALDKSDCKKALDPAQEVYKMWDADKMMRAMSHSDSIFCNEFEAKYIERYAGVENIMDLDLPLVVRTEGEGGSTAKIGGEILKIPAIKGGKVADATGAGDSYRAGFYAGMFNGYDTYESLILASATASFTLEKVGALSNIPSWDCVLDRAKEYL